MKAITTITAATLSLGAGVSALTKQCPTNGICYQLGVPGSTKSAGNGDIYFQLSAPSSMQWAALGQGTQMAGANMFIMYASADGQNVTVSPRSGKGQFMPLHDTTAEISLLEGSGIQNGLMIANVRCSNCNSWDGGSLDLTGSGSSNWIYSYKQGPSLKTNDAAATLTQHDNFGYLNFDLSQASIGQDLNPFVSDSTAPTGTSPSASGATSSSPTQTTGSSPTDTNSPSTGGSSTYSGPSGFIGLSADKQKAIIMAHGVLAGVAMVALFPIGGILMRLGRFSGLLWVHAALQLVAFAIFIAAFGLGAYMATGLKYFNNKHPIIGIVVLALLVFQPFLGFIHHKQFKRTSSRGIWSHLHINLGRIAILLGLINGNFGLELAYASKSAKIAYAVCVAVVGVVYVCCTVFGETRRKKNPPTPKSGNSPNMSDVGKA